MAANATPATKTLLAEKVPHEVHRYSHDPRSQRFGVEAVEAMGVPAGQVFKTLVVELPDGKLGVAVLPVPSKLSLKAVAAALGVARAAMADPAKAQKVTGYVVGGISPLGQRRVLPTVVDASAMTWERVFCSAGRRGMEIELAPSDLVRCTAAVLAEITAG
ncbi:Cys-tRNA(Pro) deacylase [Antrihabitans sp. YC3-6]|uniref:Cys-tRNA(Pro)/Cys-tRNA(Cys) deacylase n=1 Tax=Antrihabitans stalagmiti TaxID=2799499 RepID=A0A934U1W0_9NOCA|nr:Cys-tRNA(Pro) deacylase [Antrihabitans stalagmiti]MBJ8338387.1 Cys-tRNA(Pro) deacylase [Antrihabitans stalagmiti]